MKARETALEYFHSPPSHKSGRLLEPDFAYTIFESYRPSTSTKVDKVHSQPGLSIKCYNCSRSEHKAENCRHRKLQQGSGKRTKETVEGRLPVSDY